MTSHRPPSNVDVVLTAGEPSAHGQPTPDVPFRILVIGDFSGRESQIGHTNQKHQNQWHPIRVDRDSFSALPGKVHAEISCPLFGESAPPVTLRLAEFDDFHPDRLVRQVEPLRKLSELRERLSNPATATEAAGELRVLMESGEPPVETQSTVVPSPPSQSGHTSASATGLLDDILNKAATGASTLHPSEWQSFLHAIVKPHLAPKEHPRAPELVVQVDEAMSRILRALLHHPAFQRLESAWRGLSFVMDRLETDTPLQLFLLDLPKREFAADLLQTKDVDDTRMHRVLVQETLRTPGAPPWAVIGGVYQFTDSGEQLRLLERMGQVCRQANAPFVAGAAADLVGCPSFGTTPDPSDWQAFSAQPDGHQRWERLRRSTEAAYIGLALPRFLLRLPYGRATEAITACGFEEMVGVPDHEHYCWGNPMFACLVLLGQAFSADGWQLRPGSTQELEGLPLHVYQDATGDSVTKPCAEAWLTEQAAERLLDHGLMPLLSYKNQDRIRLLRSQSIAAPSTPLQGPWG